MNKKNPTIGELQVFSGILLWIAGGLFVVYKIINSIIKKNFLYIKNIISIVDYLNEKAGTRYQARGKDTQKHIRARLAEGFEVEQFKIVIDKKCAQWRNDPKMAEYLRPSTLFGTKFESYLNAPAPGGSAARGPNGIRIDQTKTDLDGIF